MLSSLFREFDAGDLKTLFCFFQKESIGAADFKQLPFITKLSNKRNTPRKLAAKHRLCAQIIRIAVAALAGKILPRIVCCGVKSDGFGLTEAAASTLPDVASIDFETKFVISSSGTCRA